MRATRTIGLLVTFAAACSARAADLTFEERVSAEEAIQRVYYSHTLATTAAFEEAVPAASLESRVRAYLRKSAALESFWGMSITAGMLSEEVARIDRETLLPDRIREIRGALGDDPVLFAECVARPILADRLARAAYANDPDLHAQARPWDSWWNEMASSFDAASVRTLSAVSEPVAKRTDALAAAPEGRTLFTTVWTGSDMLVWGGATSASTFTNTGGLYDPVADTWSATSTSGAPEGRYAVMSAWTGTLFVVFGGATLPGNLNTGGIYDPATDSWVATSTVGAPSARNRGSAVWTGNRMVVWGGESGGVVGSNTGALFDPLTNSWTGETSLVGAPEARSHHTAVWTGSKMIVFGGLGVPYGLPLQTGAIYDPASDTWSPMRKIPTRARFAHTAIWTGSEMIVWGGESTGSGTHPDYLNSGFRFQPDTGRWKHISVQDGPEGRYYHSAVWTGTEMIVWGGRDSYAKASGGRYNPRTNLWTPTSMTDAPGARYVHAAVWSGNVMVVWGGRDFPDTTHYYTIGGRYDPVTDTWTPTAP